MSVADKLSKTGPRKLLALDGGGIRGVLAVEVLAEMEGLLQRALGRDDSFVLADYFDYVAGTSTGAFIAACVAVGMRVDKIRRFYVDSGRQMFQKASLLRRLRYQYNEEPLANLLKAEFGAGTLLGDDSLKTLLLMMLRNATTDSPWPICNNPFAKYNGRDHPGCNLDFPLWQLVRASTAAPVFYPPEVIQVSGRSFVFVDGGVTMYNNPAFQLFLMSTIEPYNLRWPAGEEQMLLVSIGTGGGAAANANLTPEEMHLIYNATSIPAALMGAASVEQDLLCRVFGQCQVGEPIDRELGDMMGQCTPVQPRLFTYARYNADLTRDGLDELGLSDVEPGHVQSLDSVDYIPDLQRVGIAVGEQKVRPKFDSVFGRFLA